MYRNFGKQLIDIALAAVALLVALPVLGLIALMVRVKLGSPIFFTQARPGLKGRLFRICKFRTMLSKTEENGVPLPDEDRLTPFGRMLRRTSLDELPELMNVIRGDMSLVGPRPLLAEYLGRYSPNQMRRHDVRPGITGWAQINGRNLLPWEERFELDLWYVENQSLRLDLKILCLTIWKVFKREGISQPGFATAELFRGSQRDDP